MAIYDYLIERSLAVNDFCNMFDCLKYLKSLTLLTDDNLALCHITFCCCRGRLHVGDLHAVGSGEQCDQKKIVKCLQKVAQNNFTRKMIDFDTFTKLPKNVGDLDKLLLPKALKTCSTSKKSHNLVTLVARVRWVGVEK